MRLVVVGVAPGAEHHRAEAERADLDAGAAERAAVHRRQPAASVISVTTEAARSPSSSDLVAGPVARLAVDHAQRPERVALGVDQRDAGVGDDAHVADGGVVAQDAGARARRRRRSGSRRGDGVLAEGVRERRLAVRTPMARHAEAALEELAVVVDERDERDGRVHHLRGESREAVEARRRVGVEQSAWRAARRAGRDRATAAAASSSAWRRSDSSGNAPAVAARLVRRAPAGRRGRRAGPSRRRRA